MRFGLPPADRLQLQDLPKLNLAIFLSFLFVSVHGGLGGELKLLAPVFRWQRRHALLADDDNPEATEQARAGPTDADIPPIISMANWLLGAVVFIAASWPVASRAAPVLAVATLLGATATSIIGYLQSERVLRPVAVAARGGVPEKFRRPGVVLRMVLTWLLSTGVPLLAILLSLIAGEMELLKAPAESYFTPILLMALAALVVGLAGNILAAMSIADPLRQLHWALERFSAVTTTRTCRSTTPPNSGCCRPDSTTWSAISMSGSGCAILFGRYVGEDVARRALERGTELGGRRRTWRCCSSIWSVRRNWPPPGRLLRWSTCSTSSSGWWSTSSTATGASSTSSRATRPCASGAPRSSIRMRPLRRWRRHASCTSSWASCWGRSSTGASGYRRGGRRRAHRRAGAVRVHGHRRSGQRGGASHRPGQVRGGSGARSLAICVSGAADDEAACWEVGEIVELRGRIAPHPTGPARPTPDPESPTPGASARPATFAWRPSSRAPFGDGLLGDDFLGDGLLGGSLLGGPLHRSTSAAVRKQFRCALVGDRKHVVTLAKARIGLTVGDVGPEPASLITIGLPEAVSLPSSRSGGGAEAPCPPRRFGSA